MSASAVASPAIASTTDTWPLDDAFLPVHLVAVDRVRDWLTVALEQHVALRAGAAAALGRIVERTHAPTTRASG